VAYGLSFLEVVGIVTLCAIAGVLIAKTAMCLTESRRKKERLKAWKLEPCPFCKHKASIQELASDAAYVLCYECGAQTGIKPTISDAVAAWNRRAESEG
jgi:Lar family restriction alleviation protein